MNPVDGRSVVAVCFPLYAKPSRNNTHNLKQCSLDEMIRVWDMQTGQLLERFEGHTNSVYSVAFSPDGRSIVSGSLDMTLKVWDLSPATLAYLRRPAGDASPPPAPLVTKTWRRSFSGHSDFVLSVAYPGKSWASSVLGDEADWIVSASKDKTVTFWNASPSNKMDPTVCAQFTLNGHKNSGTYPV
jgi:glucose repression regulatory protein TUP1